MTKEYISLKEASKYCSYSSDYLKLRARQGKLKAIKIGRNWLTKKEWIEDYVKKQKSRDLIPVNSRLQNMITSPYQNFKKEKRWHSIIFKTKIIVWCFLFITILMMVFIVFGEITNFKPIQKTLKKIIPSKTIEIKSYSE